MYFAPAWPVRFAPGECPFYERKLRLVRASARNYPLRVYVASVFASPRVFKWFHSSTCAGGFRCVWHLELAGMDLHR